MAAYCPSSGRTAALAKWKKKQHAEKREMLTFLHSSRTCERSHREGRSRGETFDMFPDP